MNNVRGMTLKQLNDTLDQMHTVYPFKPETTRLGDFETYEWTHQCKLNSLP